MPESERAIPALFFAILSKLDVLYTYTGDCSLKITAQKLTNKDQTGKAMNRLIDQYSNDLREVMIRRNGKIVPLTSLNIMEFFDLIRRIPYRQDIKPIEVISRPNGILKNSFLGMDCKKKAILIASYFKNRQIPCRLIASSKKKNRRIHHVFPQIELAGKWLNVDATYSHYKPFEPKALTRAEVLK